MEESSDLKAAEHVVGDGLAPQEPAEQDGGVTNSEKGGETGVTCEDPRCVPPPPPPPQSGDEGQRNGTENGLVATGSVVAAGVRGGSRAGGSLRELASPSPGTQTPRTADEDGTAAVGIGEFTRMQQQLLETRAANYALEERLVRMLAAERNSQSFLPVQQAGKLLSRWGRQVGALASAQPAGSGGSGEWEDPQQAVLARELAEIREQLSVSYEANEQLRKEKEFLLKSDEESRKTHEESIRQLSARAQRADFRAAELCREIELLKASNKQPTAGQIPRNRAVIDNSAETLVNYPVLEALDKPLTTFVQRISSSLSETSSIREALHSAAISLHRTKLAQTAPMCSQVTGGRRSEFRSRRRRARTLATVDGFQRSAQNDEMVDVQMKEMVRGDRALHPLVSGLDTATPEDGRRKGIGAETFVPVCGAGSMASSTDSACGYLRRRRAWSAPPEGSSGNCVQLRALRMTNGVIWKLESPDILKTWSSPETGRGSGCQQWIERVTEGAILKLFGKMEIAMRDEVPPSASFTGEATALSSSSSSSQNDFASLVGSVKVAVGQSLVASIERRLASRASLSSSSSAFSSGGAAASQCGGAKTAATGGEGNGRMMSAEEVEREIAAAMGAAAESAKEEEAKERRRDNEQYMSKIQEQEREIATLRETLERQTRQLTQLAVQVTDFKNEIDETDAPHLLSQIGNLKQRLKETAEQLEKQTAVAQQGFEMKCRVQDLQIQCNAFRAKVAELTRQLADSEQRERSLRENMKLSAWDRDAPPAVSDTCTSPVVGDQMMSLTGEGSPRCPTDAFDNNQNPNVSAIKSDAEVQTLQWFGESSLGASRETLDDLLHQVASQPSAIGDDGGVWLRNDTTTALSAYGGVDDMWSSNQASLAGSALHGLPAERTLESMRRAVESLQAEKRISERRYRQEIRDLRVGWQREKVARQAAEAEGQRLASQSLELRSRLASSGLSSPEDDSDDPKSSSALFANPSLIRGEGRVVGAIPSRGGSSSSAVPAYHSKGQLAAPEGREPQSTGASDGRRADGDRKREAEVGERLRRMQQMLVHETQKCRALEQERKRSEEILHSLLKRFALSKEEAFRAPLTVAEKGSSGSSGFFGNLFQPQSSGNASSKLTPIEMARVMEETLLENARLKTDILTLGEEYKKVFSEANKLKTEPADAPDAGRTTADTTSDGN